MNTTKPLTPAKVKKMRELYLADSTITQTELGRKYHCSQGAARNALLNKSFYDPNYTPPSNTTERGNAGRGHWSWYERRTDDRMAREYPFNCDTCGMGYDDEDKAYKCCERVDLYVPPERNYATKWDEVKNRRKRRNKYNQRCDYANRRSR